MKKIIFLIILFIPLVVLGYNDTINPLCTIKEKDRLRTSVLNFTYALEKYKEGENVFYKVTIYNMNKDIVIDYGSKTYTVDSNIITNILPGSKLSLKIYSNPLGICAGYNITTKVIIIPFYNKYKDNALCIGNEEYFLCKENTKANIDEKEFTRLINQYVKDKSEIKKDEDEISVISEEKPYEKIYAFVREYYIYILFSIITIGVISIILLVSKKKSELF